MIRVALDLIDDNPYQTRLEYGDLADLTASLAQLRPTLAETCGLIQVPIARLMLDGQVVDPLPQDVAAFLRGCPSRVELAMGHRRKRAFMDLARRSDAAVWGELPVELRVLDDEAMAAIAWEENEKRQDISDIERAVALDRAQDEFGWTQAQTGAKFGLSQSAVANLLRLLTLPDKVQSLIRQGSITGRHGRALLPLADLEARWETYLSILQNGAPGTYRTVAEVEKAVAERIERETLDLSEVPWDETWVPEVKNTSACAGCAHRVRVGRAWRCRNHVCHHAKQQAHRIKVNGPAQANTLYNQRKLQGWELAPAPPSWNRCAGCSRRGNEVAGEWLRSGPVTFICPECAAAAQLKPSLKPETPPPPTVTVTIKRPPEPEPVTIAAAPVAPEGTPVAAASEMKPNPFAPGTWSSPAPASPAAQAATPTLPPPPPKPEPVLVKPEPAMVLTARILPGNDLNARKVMVAMGLEGHGPQAMHSGTFEELQTLIGTAVREVFGGEA
ncbi:MAG: ParB/RepB/Spo0J family partition protein [Anaerolineae bacterium]|nr:ParB/RepB/Spo0J family partition protein [Anaerolineae bacterium]